MMTVTLAPFEMLFAGIVGIRRNLEAIRKGLPNRHGYEGDGWSVHIEGAMGEMAYAKATGKYWDGSINTFRVPDSSGNVEIRTRRNHGYDLLVRDSDFDDRVYVLVTGSCGKYQIHGYIKGSEAKNREWLKDYGNREPAYFVPRDYLTPIGNGVQ